MNNKSKAPLPIGKLPPAMLRELLTSSEVVDPRVLLGPGIGNDCAIVDLDETVLVLKTDPITFASDEIGWYAVQVNANDIVTTGARPQWFLATLLLPEKSTTETLVREIFNQIQTACDSIDVSLVGGHTEITTGLDRPLLIGMMIGETKRDKIITPQGIQVGDRILLSKGVPIETIAILAREFHTELSPTLTPEELATAADYLYQPGISVHQDALIAISAGRVTAMHDPTEGGVLAALWELAEAGQCTLSINKSKIHIPELAHKICDHFDLDPLSSIASGALLITAPQDSAHLICAALERNNIRCNEIGHVAEGPVEVNQLDVKGNPQLPWPDRDALANLFD